jgi:oligopeptide/dipeptide ABC transporter ATP-binding protein
MYAGRIIEEADVKTLFSRPLHPYTQGLLASIPVLGKITEQLEVIPGTVPNLINLPPGCRFAPRCMARLEQDISVCTELEPDLLEESPHHTVRCWLYQHSEDSQIPLDRGKLELGRQ